MSYFRVRTTPDITVLLACCAFSGLYSVYLGQDFFWDLRNYHFYNAHAFLYQRLDIDILPAQLQTYINPFIDIPAYLMIRGLPPIVTGLVMGLVHGLNLFLAFKISRYVLGSFSFPDAQAFALAFLAALLGFLGAANVGQLGGFAGDSTIAIFALAAVWYVLRGLDHTQPAGTRNVALAGLFAGMATGMKLTAATVIPTSAICLLVFSQGWGRKIRSTLLFGATALLGVLLTSGYWMLILYLKFRNPLFPFYNSFFRSSYMAPVDFSVPWVLPQNAAQYLLWPVYFLTPHPERGHLRDGRLTLVFVSVIVVLSIKAFGYVSRAARQARRDRRLAPSATVRSWRNPPNALLCIFFVGYVIWLAQFGIYRYLGPLEFLSVLVVLTLFWKLVPSWKSGGLVLGVLYVLLLPTTIPANLERVGWGDDFFNVRLPAGVNLANAQVLVTSHHPLGYIFPYFPRSTQIVRLQSNLDSFLAPDGSSGLSMLVKQATADCATKFVLYPPGRESEADAALGYYGFQADFNQCSVIGTKIEGFFLCPVQPRR
jgi:hypothetical protein